MSEGRLPAKCRACRYSASVDVGLEREMLTACVYILRRFERRPCPAGEACTVFEPWRRGERSDEALYGG